MLGGISVSDCDRGVNGKIFMSTSNQDFEFTGSSLYREGTLGMIMKRTYDYETEKVIEFNITAQASESSINQFNSTALVINFELAFNITLLFFIEKFLFYLGHSEYKRCE